MNTLSQMTLFDSSGQSVTVFAPSNMAHVNLTTQNPAAHQTVYNLSPYPEYQQPHMSLGQPAQPNYSRGPGHYVSQDGARPPAPRPRTYGDQYLYPSIQESGGRPPQSQPQGQSHANSRPLGPLGPPPPPAPPQQFERQPQRSAAPHDRPSSNVYVSNLPHATTQRNLTNLFGQYGAVVDSQVAPRDGQTPVGFVQFRTPEMAQAAAQAVDGMRLQDGRLLRARIATVPRERAEASEPSPDVHVSNIPLSWKYSDLHAAFSPYGSIASHTIFKDMDTGASLGSGIVRFATTAEAATAIEALHYMPVQGLRQPLHVSYADPQEEQPRHQQAPQEFASAAPAPRPPPAAAPAAAAMAREDPKDAQRQGRQWAQYNWQPAAPSPAAAGAPFFRISQDALHSPGSQDNSERDNNSSSSHQDAAMMNEFQKMLRSFPAEAEDPMFQFLQPLTSGEQRESLSADVSSPGNDHSK